MRVRATKLGYYDHKRRREGSEFVLSDPKHFSEAWMESLDKPVVPVQSQRATEPKAVKPTGSREVI